MYLIDVDKLEHFRVKCSDGKDYVLIRAKSPYDIPKADRFIHARWNGPCEKGKVLCSKCGGEALLDSGDCGFTFNTMTEYCPHCGAKMDSVEWGKNGNN